MKQNNTSPQKNRTEVVLTADGSQTLYSERVQEHYHSTFGALQESKHIFIQAGLMEAYRRKSSQIKAAHDQACMEISTLEKEAQTTAAIQTAKTDGAIKTELTIFELGLGTGLNALLTIMEAGNLPLNLSYDCIEAYPLSPDLVQALNYPALFMEQEQHKAATIFRLIHDSEWATSHSDPALHVRFTKHKGDIKLSMPSGLYDLVYWDAFSPEKQAELWEENLFARMYQQMAKGGILVSYCAKGEIRRRLQNIGFRVERLAGPPGKREILRATKE